MDRASSPRLQQDQFGYNGVYTNSNCGLVDFATITDGSSNTAMFSETHIGAGPAANAVTLSTVNGTWRHLYVEADGRPDDDRL